MAPHIPRLSVVLTHKNGRSMRDRCARLLVALVDRLLERVVRRAVRLLEEHLVARGEAVVQRQHALLGDGVRDGAGQRLRRALVPEGFCSCKCDFHAIYYHIKAIFILYIVK